MSSPSWRKLILNNYALLLLFSTLFIIFSVFFGNLNIGQFVLRIRYLIFLMILLLFLNYANYYSIVKEISLREATKEIILTYAWLIFWLFIILIAIYSAFFGNIIIAGFMVRIKYLLGLAFILSLFLNFFPQHLPLRKNQDVSLFDSRIIVIFGLLMIIVSAFLLVVRLEPLANNAAILAYGFLVWGVLFQIIEYFKEQQTKNRRKNTEQS